MFSGILSTIRSAESFRAARRLDVPAAETLDGFPIEVLQTVERRFRATGRFGQRIERLLDELQLARAEDPWVARQDLLDERRTRARHAHDEHRPLRLQAGPAHSCEERGSESRDQPVDERSVRIGVVVHAALLETGSLQGVGLESQTRGAVELTPGVKSMGQTEEERASAARRADWRWRASSRSSPAPTRRAGRELAVASWDRITASGARAAAPRGTRQSLGQGLRSSAKTRPSPVWAAASSG